MRRFIYTVIVIKKLNSTLKHSKHQCFYLSKTTRLQIFRFYFLMDTIRKRTGGGGGGGGRFIISSSITFASTVHLMSLTAYTRSSTFSVNIQQQQQTSLVSVGKSSTLSSFEKNRGFFRGLNLKSLVSQVIPVTCSYIKSALWWL